MHWSHDIPNVLLVLNSCDNRYAIHNVRPTMQSNLLRHQTLDLWRYGISMWFCIPLHGVMVSVYRWSASDSWTATNATDSWNLHHSAGTYTCIKTHAQVWLRGVLCRQVIQLVGLTESVKNSEFIVLLIWPCIQVLLLWSQLLFTETTKLGSN